jgi:hypothetical protein
MNGNTTIAATTNTETTSAFDPATDANFGTFDGRQCERISRAVAARYGLRLTTLPGGTGGYNQLVYRAGRRMGMARYCEVSAFVKGIVWADHN